jgi:hypothetical protein
MKQQRKYFVKLMNCKIINRRLFWFRVSGIKEAQDKTVTKKLLCSHKLYVHVCTEQVSCTAKHVTRRHILHDKYQQISILPPPSIFHFCSLSLSALHKAAKEKKLGKDMYRLCKHSLHHIIGKGAEKVKKKCFQGQGCLRVKK